MKKLLLLLVVVLLGLLLFACKTEAPVATTSVPTAAQASASALPQPTGVKLEESEIRIGYYGPLTGSMTMPGLAGKNGALLYMEEINAKGGIYGSKLKMIDYDDKSSPEQAVKAVSRLVTVDKVHAIIGSLHSGNILASGPVVEGAQIPEIGTGTSPNWLSQGWTYLFRSQSNTGDGAKYLAAAMKKMGISKIDALVQQDDFGKTSWASLKDEMTKLGGFTVYNTESFQPTDLDWTGQLAKCLASDAQSIVFYATTAGFGPFYKQARQVGYKGYIFGPESGGNPDAIAVAGDTANGAVFFCAYFMPKKPEDAPSSFEKEVLTKYVARFGEMPMEITVYRSYDGMRILERAFNDAKSLNGTKVRDAIKNISDMDGLFGGKIDFTKFPNGECTDMVRVFVIHQGKIVTVDDFLSKYPADTYKKKG